MADQIPKPLTERQKAERSTWQYRAVEATRGNQSLLGCVIIRIVGHMSRNPPRFDITTSAHITSGGMLIADMQIDRTKPFLATAVGPVWQVRDELRRLADRLKLNDAERDEMFLAMRNWIGSDDRSTSDPQVAEDREKEHRRLARLRSKNTRH